MRFRVSENGLKSLISPMLPLVFFLLTSQAVTALVKNFPKHMVSSMQQILPIVWNTLTESAALYPFLKA
jgi:hypothetical protein